MDQEPAATRRYQIEIAGSALSVLEAGSGAPLLLGQGYLWDSEMWRPQVTALAARFRVIIPELWGHGGSGAMPEGTQTLEDLARQMLALLDALAIERCVVIGSSVGGMWGVHLAAMAPQRVAGLVVMNSYVGPEPEAARQGYAALLNQVEAIGAVSPPIAEYIVPLFFAADVEQRSPELPAALRQRLAALDGAAIRQSIVPLGRMIFDRGDARNILADIEAPTLVVTADGDVARSPRESAEMARMMKAELVMLNDCGHTATLEQPDMVNAVLAGFLDALGWGEGEAAG